ncbi:RNA polymerase sigma factor [Nannocystaceae bacterium ST9]
MASARTDLELLAQWRAGDRKAGSELFKRHFAAIRRFHQTTVEPAAVEELVQRTFVACVEGRDRFAAQASFRAYLFGIAHNLVREHYRGRWRRETPVDFAECSVADLGEGPSTLFARKREQRVLLEALQRIPLDQQVILQLRYWEQFSNADLARFLDISVSAVAGRLRRARELLQAAIRRIDASPDILISTLRDLDEWAGSLREQSQFDPLRALAELLPEVLGGRPLVGRASGEDGHRFSYRGGGSSVELRLVVGADVREPSGDQPLAVQGFRGSWRWDPDSREAKASVRLGPHDLHLCVQPAAERETVLALLAELDLATLATHPS